MNDNESGFYYLQSRYYDPKICRFINSDGLLNTTQGTLGYNLFAYCGNNPINRADTTGTIWRLLIAAVAVVLTGAFLSGCSSEPDEEYTGQVNCYAYALKLDNDPRSGEPFLEKPYPGYFSETALEEEDFVDGVSADAKAIGYYFSEVRSPEHKPKEGNWLIAMGYSSSGYGFHFWRQESDGTWSHKPGEDNPRALDYSDQIIIDPQTSNNGPYDCFVGYFEVGPNGG